MDENFRKEILESLKNIEGYEKYLEEEKLNQDKLSDLLGFPLDSLNEEFKFSDKRGLSYERIHPLAVSPKYNYGTDSGFDLHSVEEITIEPLGRALVPTGLKFDIDDGYEIQVRSKSGLAINQGLMVLNSPGTVDNGYTGEVKAIVFNTNQTPFHITIGMKIAQAVLCPVVNGRWVDLIEVEKVHDKDRGDKGFGSTGLK